VPRQARAAARGSGARRRKQRLMGALCEAAEESPGRCAQQAQAWHWRRRQPSGVGGELMAVDTGCGRGLSLDESPDRGASRPGVTRHRQEVHR